MGSLGRYAIMTEMTFKVFPDAPTFSGLRLEYRSLSDLLTALYFINQNAHELDALDFEPQGGGWVIAGAAWPGFEATLPRRLARFVEALKIHTDLLDAVELGADETVWQALNKLSLAAQAAYLVKVVLSPKQIPPFDAMIPATRRRYSAGGSAAWVATDDIEHLNAVLKQQSLSGLCIRGDVESPLVGKTIDNALADRVKQVFDPQNKFV